MTQLLPAPRPMLRDDVVRTPEPPARVPARRRSRAGWPLTALLVLYPLWWALGMGTLIVFVLTVPMLFQLRRRRVLVPPGFGLWLLFLVWAVASTAMVGYDPPVVVEQAVSVRLVSVIFTLVTYLAVTVILLYVGNLTEEEFPRQRLVRQLGALFCTVVAGGLLGTLAPNFQFTSPVELLMPASVRANGFVQSIVHPTAAQVMDILGYSSPRPAAPFGYTNMWGNCLALLLGWFVIGWLLRSDSRGRRILGAVVLAVAAVPAVYSLNRGMWIGLGVATLFIVIRLAARGRLAGIGVLLTVLVIGAVVVVTSPLSTLIQDRLAHPQSNSARAFTTVKTLDVMSYSPVLGFGSTRMPLGSSNSIAAGPSPGCPRCGSPPLGSNGQLWAVLIAHGIVGVLLFFGFFIRTMWVYRHDRTPIGDAGLLAILLSLFFMFVYNAVAIPLVISFLSLGLLWRNGQAAQAAAGRREIVPPGGPLGGLIRWPSSRRRPAAGAEPAVAPPNADAVMAPPNADAVVAPALAEQQQVTTPRRPGLASIARGGALNLVGAGASALVGVLLVVVVTRGLPRQDAGVFFALTSVFLIAQVLAGLGTGTGLVYFIARMRSLGRGERIKSFQRVALVPVAAVSVAATLVLAICAPIIARMIGGRAEGLPTAVIVLAVLLPVAALSDSVLAATRGHATMVPTVTVERIGRPLVQLGLVAAVILGGGSLTLLAGAWALPWLGSVLLAGWLLRRLGRSLPSRTADTTPPRTTVREFWRFTGPRVVSSVAQLVLQRFDIVLVSILIGPAQAAVYTAATRFLVVGQFASVAISNAAQPRLAELLAVDDHRSAQAVYQSATAWTVAMTWPVYLLCAVFADAVLTIFGHGYAAGQTVIIVLAAAMLFATASGMVDVMLNMAGRTSWTMGNALVAVVAMIGVDLLLIPRIGILGAAIGWATALVLQNVLPLSQLFVVLRLHPFGRGSLLAGGLSVACFGALPVVARLVFPGSLPAAVVAVVLGGAAFAAGCLRWRRVLGLPGLRALRLRRPLRAEPLPAGVGPVRG